MTNIGYRRGKCRKCGGDIFELSLPCEGRKWWHENAPIDKEHRAILKKGTGK